MVLGKLSVPGRPTLWIIVGQLPTAFAVGAGGGCLDIFSLVYHFSFLTPSLCLMNKAFSASYVRIKLTLPFR